MIRNRNETSVAIDRDMLEQFEQQGYVVVKGLLDPADDRRNTAACSTGLQANGTFRASCRVTTGSYLSVSG